MSCFSACCHQTHWKKENLPCTPQTCTGSWMFLVRMSCRSCFLRRPGGRVTTLPSKPQDKHGSPASSTNIPRTREEGQQLGLGRMSNWDGEREGIENNSHLHQCKYPWCPPLHFVDSYMFTLFTGPSRPPINHPPTPRRALRAGDKGIAALQSLACKEADREIIYLPSPRGSGISILNLSPSHCDIFTAKFPLVICL